MADRFDPLSENAVSQPLSENTAVCHFRTCPKCRQYVQVADSGSGNALISTTTPRAVTSTRRGTVSNEADLLGAFEEHSPDRIRELLAAGVSPTEPINGTRPIDSLIGMYLRSPRFSECLQIMLDAGASIGDPLLRAVLLDDDAGLRSLVARSSESLTKKLNSQCAFT